MGTKFRSLAKKGRKAQQAPFIIRKLSKKEAEEKARIMKELKAKQSILSSSDEIILAENTKSNF